MPAPIKRIITINPMAMGRLRVISGILAARMFFAGPAVSKEENVLPQTWQRVALSLKREPQVGHTRGVCCFVSGLIIIWCIPQD
jgi:hypothetical protein